jgi:hypothetical protein
MSGIRVTYSGMISFVVGLASLFTGLIFTLIITRQLSQEEFGGWSLIGSLIAYVLVIHPIVSYWSTREIARGVESGKTAFISSGGFSMASLLIFFGIAYFFGVKTDIDLNILLLAGILIPVEFLRAVLVGITQGYRPQNEEYGILIFELTKIPLALLIIFYFDLGLVGVIITVFISRLASVITMLIQTRERLKGKFNKKSLKKWIKLFWLPIYPYISAILTTSDVAIFSIMTGSVFGLAYWSAATTISRIVNHSAKIGKAVYPKLLEGGKRELFQENLIRIFYFAFPLAAMSFVFSKPALFALNPLYSEAATVMLFLVPMIFLRTFSELFSSALQGIEKVDTRENATFRDYIRSKLFFIPTVRIVQRSLYLISLTVMLFLMIPSNQDQIQLVVYWAIIALAIQIPYTGFLYLLIKKEFTIRFDKKALFKYFSASVVAFGFTFLLMEEYLEYKISIFEFLPEFLQYVIIGVLFYLAITYIIDPRTRKLTKAIVSEVKNR